MSENYNMEAYRADIERLSSTFNEKDGMTPVCGRILNYLLLKPTSEATFDELKSYFNVSKSAISNALKQLENTKTISAKTKNGQRKRYFSINMNIKDVLTNIYEKHISLKRYISELRLLRTQQDNVDQNITEILRFIEFTHDHFLKLINEFNNLNTEQTPQL